MGGEGKARESVRLTAQYHARSETRIPGEAIFRLMLVIEQRYGSFHFPRVRLRSILSTAIHYSAIRLRSTQKQLQYSRVNLADAVDRNRIQSTRLVSIMTKRISTNDNRTRLVRLLTRSLAVAPPPSCSGWSDPLLLPQTLDLGPPSHCIMRRPRRTLSGLKRTLCPSCRGKRNTEGDSRG